MYFYIMNAPRFIYNIKKYIILVFILILFSNPFQAQVGAYTVGYNSTSTAKSITLPTGNLYLCLASTSGSTLTPGFTALVNNAGYAAVGYSTTNSCSITTTATSYAVGGITVNNFTSSYTYVTGTSSYSNTGRKAVINTWYISFTLTDPSSVYILISVGATGNGAYISSVTLPTGCSQIFLTNSGTVASVYAAYCKNLSPGSYTVTVNTNVGARVNANTPTNMYAAYAVFIFPIFLFSMSSSPSSITQIPGQSNTSIIYINKTTSANSLPVSLSCTTNSTNLGCSLSSSTVTPNATVILTINSTYNIAPGTYLVNVSGIAPNNATNYTIITVNIPSETISISASPSSVNLIPGQSNTSIITASTNYGYNLNISVSCPTGFICTVSPNPISSGSSTTLNISASLSVTPGTYTVNITVTDVNTGNYNTTSIIVTVPSEVITVSANPSSLGASSGSNVSTTITASTNYGYSLSLSCSNLPSGWTCNFNPSTISSGGSSTLTISVPSSASSGIYSINVIATDIITNNSNTTTITVIVESLILSLNQTSANVNSGQTVYVQVNGSNNLGNDITLKCLAPSGVTCSPTEVNISSGGSYVFSITAPNVNIYQQYNITFLGIDVQTKITNSTIFTLNVYPNPVIYISSPSNNTLSNYYALDLIFYTNYPTVNVTINGIKYTITVVPGTNTISFRYNVSSYGLPGLVNIIPNGGNLSIELAIQSPTGLSNSTGIYVYQLPPPVLSVDYTSPTPNNATTSNIWLLQVAGSVLDNTLANDYCYLELFNPNTSIWDNVSYLQNCAGYIYNENLSAYAINTESNYAVWYRIKVINSYGLVNVTPARVIYFDYNSNKVTVISPSSPYNIQSSISNAIANGTNYIVFSPGVYYVNLFLNYSQPIIFLGSGVTLMPFSVASPVITVASGNVTLDGININSKLYGIKIDGGVVYIKNSEINTGLYGIQTTGNSSLILENSVVYGKVSAVYTSGLRNSYIYSSKISSDVWGIYLKDSYNVIIDRSKVDAKVFGILIEGNSTNNIINGTEVNAKVFGILISSGENNIINNSIVNAQIFGIKLPSNNVIENTILDNIKVFGIYSSGPNVINNVTIYGGVFAAYMTGNATNLSVYNSKLGLNLFGSGKLVNLMLGDTLLDIEYSGDSMIYKKDPTKNPDGLIYTGYGFMKLGSALMNVTFKYTGSYTKLYVYRILGLVEKVADGNSTQISDLGIYALYKI